MPRIKERNSKKSKRLGKETTSRKMRKTRKTRKMKKNELKILSDVTRRVYVCSGGKKYKK
jgi:hypothetical protein